MPFEDSANKRTIRGLYDLPILRNWEQKINCKLTYFGMPGPELHDLIDWAGVLDRRRTGIESPGRSKREREVASEAIGRLNMNLMADPRISSSGFELMIADVEDVIIYGVDSNGRQPCMSDKGEANLARFAYDLVNLDFDGGLGYTNEKGEAKRISAIKKLFERQRGHNFILLVTVNVRHTLGNEFEDYLKGMRHRCRDAESLEAIDWYLDRGDGELEYKIKATVPSFVQSASETNMFKCRCYPPVSYEGHRSAHMLHFVFELDSQAGNLKAWSLQDDQMLLGLPLLRCSGGKLIEDQRADLPKLLSSAGSLEMLPKDTLAAISMSPELGGVA